MKHRENDVYEYDDYKYDLNPEIPLTEEENKKNRENAIANIMEIRAAHGLPELKYEELPECLRN